MEYRLYYKSNFEYFFYSKKKQDCFLRNNPVSFNKPKTLYNNNERNIKKDCNNTQHVISHLYKLNYRLFYF